MKVSLRKIAKEAIFYYAKKERTKWVLENIVMVVVVST
jgi:hypothetical protein